MTNVPTPIEASEASEQPLAVEIWSDVACPFCYIGKREFENALERFPHKDRVRVTWKSFELDPKAPSRSDMNTYQMLAHKYGMSIEQARDRVRGVVERAASLGLSYDMDATVIANSFDAHRLIQLAKTHGLGDAAEERLFKAYFIEGANIADAGTLVRLGTDIGLAEAEVRTLLAGMDLTDAVRLDEREARQLGISGVPFFVLDRRYAVSGAQHADHFLGALQQAWQERLPVGTP
ncbi:MAG: DsbA family oxidoreductase [Flavobacteriales bacterium]